MLIVVEDLLAELVDELVEAQVNLSLYLVVQELPLEVVESVASAITVQVQGVQNVLHHVSLLVLQDVVGEDPRQGHLDWELDPLSHGQLQVELPEPQLRQVTTLSQGTW